MYGSLFHFIKNSKEWQSGAESLRKRAGGFVAWVRVDKIMGL